MLKHFYLDTLRFISNTSTIAEYELRKLWHSPTELLTRSLQPAFWLLLFGQVMSRTNFIDIGTQSYISFLAPGILSQSALFVAIFHGIAVIWERDLGIIHKILVTQTSRIAIILGKSITAGVRAFSQCFIVYFLAWILGAHLNWSPIAIMGVVFFIFLSAALFSTFSLIIACIVKTKERFMGVGQAITMPLFFASNAIYPIAIMPTWLQFFSRCNPLSYEVDALRSLMIADSYVLFPSHLGTDFMVLSSIFLVLLIIGAWIYPTVTQ